VQPPDRGWRELRDSPDAERRTARGAAALAPGEECCISYGDLANDLLFLDYVRARAAAMPRRLGSARARAAGARPASRRPRGLTGSAAWMSCSESAERRRRSRWGARAA